MVDEIECAYSDEGQGEAIFFVHGIGARRGLWADVISQLKDRYRCISYDLRGHGDSPFPHVSFGLDQLVNDLEMLRERLGIGQAHIVGHSLGGMIGPAYAKRYPERVLSLGLLSTAAFRTADDSSKVQGLVASMKASGVATSLDVLVNRWFSDEFAQRFPEIVDRRKRQVIDTDAEVFLNVFDIYSRTEMSPWLADIQCPALVMTGELDGGCSPRLNIQIAAAMPNSKLVVLKGLKHAIVIEAPDLVATHLRDFLLDAAEQDSSKGEA